MKRKEPIEKIFHNKDLNIAYAKGKGEAYEEVKRLFSEREYYLGVRIFEKIKELKEQSK